MGTKGKNYFEKTLWYLYIVDKMIGTMMPSDVSAHYFSSYVDYAPLSISIQKCNIYIYGK